MRLCDYIKLSSNEDDIATFRSLSIKLVKKSDSYNDTIERLSEKYEYIKESFDILESINKYLKSVYTGDYKFDFCIDEGQNSSILAIKKGQKILLSMRCHETNDNLCRIKRILEEDIRSKN